MDTKAKPFEVTGIDLCGYMVTDMPRALAFYRDMLGLEPTTVYPGDRGAEYEFSDGTAFGLMSADESMPFRAGTGVLFAVDDFDAAVAAAKAYGVTMHMEYESPVCYSALTEDPDGNHIIIHKRKNVHENEGA